MTATAVVLVRSAGSEAGAEAPAGLRGQLMARMRTALEQEPAGAASPADVRTVYGFHLCGVAEKERP